MFKKKGVVSITTFSLFVLILFLVLTFSYGYYTYAKGNYEVLVKEQEIQNSVGKFKSQILNSVLYNNSEISYSDNFVDENLILYLNNNKIEAQLIYVNSKIVKNYSTYGIQFCNQYNISPIIENKFIYNNSCLQLITS